MLLVIELDVADLAAARFSISPLYERVRARPVHRSGS
jgi:hypothetical protein